MIEQVGGALGHAAATATRTERAALTVKRDEPVDPQSPQRNRANPPASQPHCRNSRNSCSTKRGRPSPSRKLGACAKGLEVIAHDLEEHALRGTPRFVARRGRDHSRPEGGRRANAGLEEIGLNSRAREPQVADIAVLASGVIAVLATRNEAFLTLPTEMRLP